MSTVTTASTVAAVVAAALATSLLLPVRSTPPVLPSAPRQLDDRDNGEGPLLFRLLVTPAVGLAAAVLVGGPIGLPLGAVLAALTWWLSGRLEPPAVRRRRQQLEAAVPHAVDLMAACLAAGLSPGSALAQVREVVDDPLSHELTGVARRLELGVDPATVWRDVAAHPQLGGLGRTMSRAVESGASVSDAMQRLADDLRARGRAQVETRARAVGVKAALPLGGCLLPAFVLVGVVPLVAGSLAFLVR
jgi:Flp pilus assembly protein TadB